MYETVRSGSAVDERCRPVRSCGYLWRRCCWPDGWIVANTNENATVDIVQYEVDAKYIDRTEL